MGRTLFVTGIRRPEEMRERGGMRADLLLRVGASELIDELLCNFKQFVSCAIALNHLSVPHHVLPQGIYHTVPEKLRRHLLRALYDGLQKQSRHGMIREHSHSGFVALPRSDPRLQCRTSQPIWLL